MDSNSNYNSSNDSNSIIEQIKINDSIFTNYKNHIDLELEQSKISIQQLDNEHNLIFNQYLPKEYRESPCVKKEKALIECLTSKKDFILCSDILNEFAKCQEKYIKEYNK